MSGSIVSGVHMSIQSIVSQRISLFVSATAAIARTFFLLLCAIALAGCEAVPIQPSSLVGTTTVADRQALARDLARLDALSWYIVINQTSGNTSDAVSLHAKVNVGQVSDVAVYSQGSTLREALSSVLRHIDATVPNAPSRGGSHSDASRMEAVLRDIDSLNALCWETKLHKNNGWTASVKARRPDELVNRSAYVQKASMSDAVGEALRQIKRSGA